MVKVYFSKEIDKIINKIDFSKLGNNIAIKVHFGEKGCTTYINPEIVRKVYDKVVGMGKKASLVECNVLYRGSRINSSDHIKTAKEHGFDFAPIDILDGEMGDKFIEVDVGGIADKAKLGKGLERYDSMIVISHFKGHIVAGYGGAFKNIGMGLGNRAGKLHMHSEIKPSVNIGKCIGCGVCAENCNDNAITISNGKAHINHEICIGCAMCIAVCPERAVRIPWGGSPSSELQKKIVDYSKGVMKLIPKMVFINVLEDITEGCDCMNIKQEPMMEDIGILISDDIVAIDKAGLDLVNEKSNNRFDKIYSHIDNNVVVDYAAERELGEKEYELVNLE